MCKSPTYILNPSIGRLNYSGYTEMYAYGELISSGRFRDYSKKPLWILHRYGSCFAGKTQKQLDDDFKLYNPTTKKSVSLIMAAPCRHCDECLKNRYSELLSRAKFEYASDPNQELAFFTLTYAAPYLPDGENVSREDINDFRRKFSVYFNRLCNKSGQYDTPRMVICSEYGPAVDKLGRPGKRRPHYHGFMYLGNYRPSDQLSPVEYYNELHSMFKSLQTAVFRAWHRCFRVGFNMQLAKHPLKTLNYCTKYVLKQTRTNCVPKGRLSNFTSLPRGIRGGLSVPYLFSQAGPVLDQSTIRYRVPLSFRVWNEFANRYDLIQEVVNIPKFLIDKTFPTFSRINTSTIHNKIYHYEQQLSIAQQLYSFYRRSDRQYDRTFGERCGSLLNSYQTDLSYLIKLLLPPFSKRKPMDYSQLHGCFETICPLTYESEYGRYRCNSQVASSVFFPTEVSWTDPLGILPPAYERTPFLVDPAPEFVLNRKTDFRSVLSDLLASLGNLSSSLHSSIPLHSIECGFNSQRTHDLYMQPMRNFLERQPDKVVNQTKMDSFYSKVDAILDFSFEEDNSNDDCYASLSDTCKTIINKHANRLKTEQNGNI